MLYHTVVKSFNLTALVDFCFSFTSNLLSCTTSVHPSSRYQACRRIKQVVANLASAPAVLQSLQSSLSAAGGPTWSWRPLSSTRTQAQGARSLNGVFHLSASIGCVFSVQATLEMGALHRRSTVPLMKHVHLRNTHLIYTSHAGIYSWPCIRSCAHCKKRGPKHAWLVLTVSDDSQTNCSLLCFCKPVTLGPVAGLMHSSRCLQ